MDLLLTGVVPVVGVYYLPSFSILYLSLFILLSVVYSYAIIWFRCGEKRPLLQALYSSTTWAVWAVAVFILMKTMPGLGGVISSIGGVFLIGTIIYHTNLQKVTGCFEGTSLVDYIRKFVSYLTSLANPLKT